MTFDIDSLTGGVRVLGLSRNPGQVAHWIHLQQIVDWVGRPGMMAGWGILWLAAAIGAEPPPALAQIPLAQIPLAQTPPEEAVESEEISKAPLPAPDFIPQIPITAGHIVVPPAQVGSAVTLLTGAEIAKEGLPMLSEHLRSLPGLAVNQAGPLGANTQLRIRGAEANHTLVLIDGVEANDPAIGSEFNFAHLPAYDIERVEIVRGPQSAIWGSDAIGGVVNITTRRGQSGFLMEGFAEGGSLGTGAGGISLSDGGAWGNLRLSSSYLEATGINISEEGEEQDGYRNFSTAVNSRIFPADNIELHFFGRYVEGQNEYDVGDPPADGDADSRFGQFYGGAEGLLSMLDGSWEHRLRYGITDIRNRNYEDGEATTRTAGQKQKWDYQTHIHFATPGFLKADHDMVAVAEREAERFSQKGAVSPFGDPNQTQAMVNYGFAGEYRLDLLDRVFLSAGLRHDVNERFLDATTYRLTGALQLYETGTRIHGTYGTGVKNPTFSELYGFFGDFVGNSALQPESSTGWDAGVAQELWGGALQLDLTYFQQDLQNEISTDYTFLGGQFIGTPFNEEGISRRQGVEISVAAELLDDVSLRGTYSYIASRDPDGRAEIRRPRHLASLNAEYRFAQGKGRLAFGLDFNGRSRDLDFAAPYPFPTVFLGDYLLATLGASYALSPNLELYTRIENALDHDYQEILHYETPGIEAYAGLRLRFGEGGIR